MSIQRIQWLRVWVQQATAFIHVQFYLQLQAKHFYSPRQDATTVSLSSTSNFFTQKLSHLRAFPLPLPLPLSLLLPFRLLLPPNAHTFQNVRSLPAPFTSIPNIPNVTTNSPRQKCKLSIFIRSEVCPL